MFRIIDVKAEFFDDWDRIAIWRDAEVLTVNPPPCSASTTSEALLTICYLCRFSPTDFAGIMLYGIHTCDFLSLTKNNVK